MDNEHSYLSHSRRTAPAARNNQGSNQQDRARGFFRTWAPILGGGTLAALGISRRNWAGAGVAALGGYLVFDGIRSTRHQLAPVHVQRSFTINRPPDEVFNFWRNFENLPRFTRHLKSVRTTGSRYSHWEARAPMGMSVAWDAEITDERENEYIVWQSLPGSSIENRGSVEFRPAPFHGGTEIKVALDYLPPAGKLGHYFATMFGESPERQVREDLRRFKQLMEAGEIPTIEGQSSGRRTPWVRMMQAASAEQTSLAERRA